MSIYKAIDHAVNILFQKSAGKKIAIYPFGEIGIKAKESLNWRYGWKESLIVDNALSTVNPKIFSFEQVNNPSEYIWLLATINTNVHNEILYSIKDLVPAEQIVDIYAYLYKDKRGQSRCYSKEYRLLSKIGEPGRNNDFCREFLELIEKKKNERRIISVAEIGVDIGATAVEVCKRLQQKDTYYAFDFDYIVEDLLYDLKRVPGICCNLVGKGNSSRYYDSYGWSLSELLFEMRNNNENGMFDIVISGWIA